MLKKNNNTIIIIINNNKLWKTWTPRKNLYNSIK